MNSLITKQEILFYKPDDISVDSELFKQFVRELRSKGGSWSPKYKEGSIQNIEYDPSIIEFISKHDQNFNQYEYDRYYSHKPKVFESSYLKNKYGLFDVQVTGVNFLLDGFNKLLADEQGIGKTVQSVVACIEAGFDKVLVILPSGVIYQFIEDITTFASNYAIGYSIKKLKGGANTHFKINHTNFYLINYESVKKYYDSIVDLNPDCIIIDEAHRIKNDKTQWNIPIMNLSKIIPYSIEMSGTPLPNRPIELFNILYVANHKIARDRYEYGFKYCGAKRTRFGLDLNSIPPHSTLMKLADELKGFFVRRFLSDCYDIPENHIDSIGIDFEETDEYRMLFQNYMKNINHETQNLFNIYKSQALVIASIQLRYLSKLMVPYTYEVFKSFEQKTIIFTSYVDSLKAMCELLSRDGVKYLVYNSELNDEEKEETRVLFQSDESYRCIVVLTESGSTGITLHKATVAIFNDYSKNPVHYVQACNRHYRLGQTSVTFTLNMFFKNTIMERMFEKLVKKKAISHTIFAVETETDDVLDELFK